MSRKNALLAQRGPQGEGTLCRNAHEYVLKQRDRRQGLPHFRHLLWPKLGPILPLLLEQLQNSKCTLSFKSQPLLFINITKFIVFFRTSTLSLRLLQQAVRAMVREGSDWSIDRFPAVRELWRLVLSKPDSLQYVICQVWHCQSQPSPHKNFPTN